MKVRAAIVLFVLVLLSSAAHAEKRFALLIGNQSYDPSVGILKNPLKDIAVVGDALANQGFEVLPPIKDARRSGILGGVRDLVRRLNAAGVGAIGFIYYSGHGAAEKDTNINYLIPIDAKEPGTTAFWDDSVKLDDVLRLLEGARSAAKFIVFDACRNELQLPTKDTSKGLVPVAEQQGMFIAYASAPGRTASDRGDRSGPYAAALAAEFSHPGLDHLNLFQNVKETVLAATGGAQQPWESNGLGRRVYLTGPPKTVDVPVMQTGDQDQLSEASREWSRVDKTSIAELETFLSRHASSTEAEYARARLAPLKKQQSDLAQQAADAAKKKAVDEARAKGEADLQRLALLQKQQADAAQQAANAAKKKADDDEQAKAAAERQRLAMLQQQEADAAKKRAEATTIDISRIVGPWRCKYTNTVPTDPPFQCKIRRDGSRIMFEKFSGSIHMYGELKADERGISYTGVWYLPGDTEYKRRKHGENPYQDHVGFIRSIDQNKLSFTLQGEVNDGELVLSK